MDVRDIMIGDYVEDPDYGVCKVVAINLSMGGYALSLEIVGDITEPFVCVDPKGVNPIPLTFDILKKNEFKFHRGETGMYGVTTAPYYQLKNSPKIWCDGNPFSVWFEEPVDIKYVHELQHLLRFCRIKKEIEL